MRRFILVALSIALIQALFSPPTRAEEDRPVDTKGPHPLAVLRATFRNDGNHTSQARTGEASIWLRNMVDSAVDGVHVSLRLMDGSRLFQKLDKKVDRIEAGKKVFIDLRWDDYQNRTLEPQIWVTYNGPKGPVTFRAEPPVW